MLQRELGHRYKLTEFIGGGGMADVYKAHDKLLDRSVAVKILHEQFRNDEEFIGKFHLEAKSAAGLSHPNIVSIYDVGVEGNDHYIVMEYVPGSTLKTKIKNEGRIETKEALGIAREIAEALAHAHANNIVHCDIKPHNILMTAQGHAKVADFGIARAVTESTMTYSGNVVGSVHYFSPEQAKGSFITPKSDVYSLGVVLYEMLTGSLPFKGETPVSIAMKHLEEQPRPVRFYNENIPPVVEAVVMKALEKDPALRPSSAEFAESLAEAERMLQAGAESDPFATKIIPELQEKKFSVEKKRGIKDESTDEKKSFFASKLFILGLFVVLFFGFCVGAFLSFGKFWSQEEIAVPDVVGKQMTLARQILEDEHLRVNVAETYDADVPAGQVVSQTPDAGSTVKIERLVTIYVSKGGEDLSMPDLAGLSRADAEAKIKKLGLKLGSIYEKYSEETAGTVVGHDPRLGMAINKGDTVDLTVSKGAREKTLQRVIVPNVAGGALDAARGSIADKGLVVGNVTKQPSRQAEGTVVSQSPAAGSEVEEGTAINLVIAEAEAEQTAPQNDAAPQADNAAKNTSSEPAANSAAPGRGNESGKSR